MSENEIPFDYQCRAINVKSPLRIIGILFLAVFVVFFALELYMPGPWESKWKIYCGVGVIALILLSGILFRLATTIRFTEEGVYIRTPVSGNFWEWEKRFYVQLVWVGGRHSSTRVIDVTEADSMEDVAPGSIKIWLSCTEEDYRSLVFATKDSIAIDYDPVAWKMIRHYGNN